MAEPRAGSSSFASTQRSGKRRVGTVETSESQHGILFLPHQGVYIRRLSWTFFEKNTKHLPGFKSSPENIYIQDMLFKLKV